MHRKNQSVDHEAETFYSKATKSELSKDYNTAFQFYVKAAESYLHLGRSSNHSEKDKARWKANAAKALERAEKLKNFIQRPSSSTPGTPITSQSSTSEVRLAPVAIDHFTAQEQSYVLKKGELVNGLRYPFWDEPSVTISSGVFSDPDGQPQLSPEQQKVSAIWRRPDQSFNDVANLNNQRILPEDILQHVVTDCSVCASISVCLAHDKQFDSSLAQLSLYPFSAGRYDIKALFNGAWRRIVIDDSLPYNPADNSLMCMSVLPSESNRGATATSIIWPSLLEKAYIKLMGGYDFLGSNSSIDLHALIGWIPDHIEIKSSSFEREKTWSRMLNGFLNGQCVVTIGTGIHSTRWNNIELLPSHSYAVIDVTEIEGDRRLTILDSWVRPKEGNNTQSSRILRIPWTDVLYIFDGIYLSWDPSTRPNTKIFHCMWKRNPDDEPLHHIRLKFCVNCPEDEEIWILLTRHIVDTQRTTDFISLRAEVEDDILPGPKAIDLHTISSTGTYTNSSHVLVRMRIPRSQKSGTLSIFASYEGPSKQVGFTLTAYAPSNTTISWDEHPPVSTYSSKAEGTFTSKNAGGNCTYPTFMANPQYFMRIHSRIGNNISLNKAQVTIVLQTKKDIPVNIAAVWSQGERITELIEKDISASSGAYTYGLARVSKELSVGDYTIVASAFEPQYMGPFSLKVECSYPFDLKPIPQEGAGMYDQVIRDSWNVTTAGGGPSHRGYSRNPIFELDIPSTTQLKIRLQLAHPSQSIAINLAVYPASASTAVLQRHVTTSGDFDDGIAGVATPQVTLNAGKYWVIPSTYHPGVESDFRLIIYSSAGGVKVRRHHM